MRADPPVFVATWFGVGAGDALIAVLSTPALPFPSSATHPRTGSSEISMANVMDAVWARCDRFMTAESGVRITKTRVPALDR
jgi:hypothetical protein